MVVFVVEYDNPECRPEPDVVLDGSVVHGPSRLVRDKSISKTKWL